MKKQAFQQVTPNVNFPEMEKKLLAEWYEKGIVDQYLHRNDASKKRFSFLDGPITANNPMGVHHAWGRTFKDLWQRFYAMRGYKERFQNGFDCQGLWVEVEVEKELGIKNKKDIENLVPSDPKASIAEFVELCKARVLKYSAIQTEQSKRLGYFMDWEHSYFTMSDENNYMIWHFLKTCFDKGWIYKGRDSVPWCPRCQTAISQHEMLTEDYKEVTHETVFFKLPILNRDYSLVAWTTTPWTIPANVALAVNPKYKYRVWNFKGEKLVTVSPHEIKKRESYDTEQFQWYEENVIKAGFKHVGGVPDIDGKDLVGLRYRGPFDDLPRVQEARRENLQTFHTVVAAEDLVVANKGTGILHVAPGAGQEDFQLAQKAKLPVISLIADDASYLEGMGEFTGKNAKKHPEEIIRYLEEKESGKYLHNVKPFAHRYPACWRCKTELVWKVADEWYIAMDRPSLKASDGKRSLREQMIEVAKKIEWHPTFGLERELDWLSNMHDWLISKPNRYWGLALPIYECKSCGWFTVIGSKEELKTKAVAGWNEFEGHSPHKPFIDDVKIRCEKCGETVSRLNDVGNVWLDAGIVPFSTYIDPKTKKLSYTSDKKYWEEWFPTDFITESFPGQFKNWFYSMIAMATVLEKKNPYKTVLGYASMLGEDGRPMHKSWGNAIEFNEGAEKIGADVMRWMFVTHDPEQNLLFGYKKADETRRKFHLLLWNVYNFFVTYANVDGWEKTYDPHKSKNILDQWILSELNQLVKIVTQSLENYDVMTASNSIETFVTDLSQWYVRRSRDRVGPTVAEGEDKRFCYGTLWEVLVSLCQLLGPFTPFLAEEIYKNLTGEASVHLSEWPTIGSIDGKLNTDMRLVRKICEFGHAIRKEEKIKVRQPLQKFTISNVESPVNENLKKIIQEELNVKEIIVEKGKGQFIGSFNTVITEQLRSEGEAREMIRQIQLLRKVKGCRIDERVKVQLPKEYRETTYLDYIKRETLADSVVWGESLDLLIS